MCSGRVGSSCSTSGTRRVNLVTNPVISHDREVFTSRNEYFKVSFHDIYRLVFNEISGQLFILNDFMYF